MSRRSFNVEHDRLVTDDSDSSSGRSSRGSGRWIFYGLVLVALAAVGISLGLVRPWESSSSGSEATVAVQVTSLGQNISALGVAASRVSGRPRLAALVPTDAVASATAFAYAQIDELRLYAFAVRAASRAGGGRDLASTAWGAYLNLTLAPGAGDAVPITDTIERMAAGAYFATDFVFWNRWHLKAVCRTATRFVYTTATGVVALPHANVSNTTMPGDYAAFEYDHLGGFEMIDEGDHAANVIASRYKTYINSQYAFDVENGTAVTLLVDLNYVVACYDGTDTAGAAPDDAVPPLGANYSLNDNEASAITFAWANATFGFTSWTLPVFVHAAAPADAAAVTPVGETYALATSADALFPNASLTAPMDWAGVTLMTVVWSNASVSAELLDVKIRGRSSSIAGLGVWGGVFGCARAAEGSTEWECFNGQQKWYSYEMLRERVIGGLVRLGAVDGAPANSTITVRDGTECAADPCATWDGEPVDGRNCTQTANACSNATATYYYVRLPRT